MRVRSRNRKRWERRGEEVGGCIRQPVADALWELSDRFDVGVWYKCKMQVCLMCTTSSVALS